MPWQRSHRAVSIVDGNTLNADIFTFRLDGSGMRNVTMSADLWETAVDSGPVRR